MPVILSACSLTARSHVRPHVDVLGVFALGFSTTSESWLWRVRALKLWCWGVDSDGLGEPGLQLDSNAPQNALVTHFKRTPNAPQTHLKAHLECIANATPKRTSNAFQTQFNRASNESKRTSNAQSMKIKFAKLAMPPKLQTPKLSTKGA